MELEMETLSGFVYNFCNNFEEAKDFYENALKKAGDCDNERSKAIALCNIGIIEAEKDYEDFITGLNN